MIKILNNLVGYKAWSMFILQNIKFEKMKTITLLTAILWASFIGNAQITFEKTYGGNLDDSGQAVLQTNDNGYIITGAIGVAGHGEDVCLIKTDEYGNVQWSKTYGGIENEQGVTIHQTMDGGYFVICRKGEMGSFDIYLIKTDENGDTLLTKTYGDYFNDLPIESEQTNDDGYIITGQKGQMGNSDVFLMKINENGDIIWTKTFGGFTDDSGNSVYQTNDNGFIISGWTYSFGAGNSDVYLIKTNEIGDTTWTKTIGGPDYEYGGIIFQTSDEGYIISGTSEISPTWDRNVYLIKTDENGNSIWTKSFGGLGSEYPSSMKRNNDNGYIITGKIEGYGNLEDVYLIKIDENGDSLWTKSIGGAANEAGYSVQQTNDNGFVIAGVSNSFSSGDYDIYLIKTNENGLVLGNNEYLSEDFNFNIFPNPGSGLFTIDFANTERNLTSLEIYNLDGQLIYNRNLENNYNRIIQIDLSNHPKGFYFVQVQTFQGILNKRLVIK
jgi:regulation of enolase protein 1 (concanavalin A-like superfamily)